MLLADAGRPPNAPRARSARPSTLTSEGSAMAAVAWSCEVWLGRTARERYRVATDRGWDAGHDGFALNAMVACPVRRHGGDLRGSNVDSHWRPQLTSDHLASTLIAPHPHPACLPPSSVLCARRCRGCRQMRRDGLRQLGDVGCSGWRGAGGPCRCDGHPHGHSDRDGDGGHG